MRFKSLNSKIAFEFETFAAGAPLAGRGAAPDAGAGEGSLSDELDDGGAQLALTPPCAHDQCRVGPALGGGRGAVNNHEEPWKSDEVLLHPELRASAEGIPPPIARGLSPPPCAASAGEPPSGTVPRAGASRRARRAPRRGDLGRRERGGAPLCSMYRRPTRSGVIAGRRQRLAVPPDRQHRATMQPERSGGHGEAQTIPVLYLLCSSCSQAIRVAATRDRRAREPVDARASSHPEGAQEQASLKLGLIEDTVFAGRYRVLRRLGAGGMGAVYEALHAKTDRRCALKIMHPHIAERRDLRERFALEAKIAARVGSDGVVDVLDAGVDEASGAPFLVMELLRGEDLSKRLKRIGRLSPAETVSTLHQTAVALDTMHRASVIHRDLKPGNLFLADQDGQARIKVLDFGVAKLMVEATVTGTTAIVGTPLYMAPEQLQGMKVTTAVDRYALGMIAYALLVGEAYWTQELVQHDNLLAFARVAVRGPEERPSVRASRRGVDLPLAFDGWFARATQVDPSQRFASARAAVEALADVWGLDVPGGGDEPTGVVELRGAHGADVMADAARAGISDEGNCGTVTASGAGTPTIDEEAALRSRA